MRIALLGFGLIGGSIARALRRPETAAAAAIGPAVDITAWSPSGRGPRAALADRLVDRSAARLEDALDAAELVVLAAPPLDCLRILDAIGGPLRAGLAPNATVTDVASTKVAIVERAAAHHLPFVGGHPMAGRESSGFAAATADLFEGRPWVVVPGLDAGARDVERVERLARSCGAQPVRMTADAHDSVAAAISHLPLVVAAALVEAVAGPAGRRARTDWATERELAASGWRDMTRLARGDPSMGAGILATNAGPVVARLEELRNVIDEWLGELRAEGGPDADALEAHLRAVRARLEAGPDAG